MQDTLKCSEVLALPYECWRWIPGYEGLYQVSTRGRVRSVDRWETYANGAKHFYKGQILKLTRLNGYLYVNLSRNDKRRLFRVNRLVAMAWIDNPESKPEVNHLDELKDNNDVYNLEWCTSKENINYGTGIKRRATSQLNGSCSKPVQAINPSTGEVVLEFPSAMEAERNGFGQGAISCCCLGKKRYKTHKGFIWRFKES